MAKFCTQCGKELNGKPCDCEKEKIKQAEANYGKVCIDTFKNMFTKPIDTLKTFIDEKNVVASLILIGVSILLTSLFLCLSVKELSGSFRYNLGMHFLENSISYPRIFLTSAFILVLIYALTIGLLYLLADKLWKGKTSYKKIVTLLGAIAPIMIMTVFFVTLFMYISLHLMGIIFLAGISLYSIYLYRGLKEAVEIEESKLAYLLVSTNIILYIIIFYIVPAIIN